MTATVDPRGLELTAEAPEPTSETDRCAGRHRRTVLYSLVVLPVWALVCTSVLETPLWWGYVVPRPEAPFVVLGRPLDAFFVLLVLLLLWCVSGRLWLSMGLLLGITAALSAVNVAKMKVLTEPLFPTDYQFLHDSRFLLDMVKPGSVAEAVVGLVVLTVGTLAASRVMGRRFPRMRRADHPRGWGVLVGIRLVGTVTILALLSSALHFNEAGNPWRKLYDANGSVWQPFSQMRNYRTNGFVGGALYNMPTTVMAEPADYSDATMQAIAQKYAARAAARNTGRTAGALDGVNVVLVLSEAFGDLSRLKDVTVAHDTIPLTRQTMADSWGGNTLANFYGTGTSSMEFEALTGQSLGLFTPQMTAPYQNFMTSLSSYPSAVGWFAQHGHVPIAIHPYEEEFYRRNQVYPMLGFQKFIYDRTMSEQTKLEHSDYISDGAAFDEVEQQLRSHDKPLLVNLVTMQNHVPTFDWYDDPVPVKAPGDPEMVKGMAGYARGQEYTDQALHTFLGDLKASGEQTVVVFYGDHYPATLTEDVYEANPGLGHLETPMFIWSTQGQSPRKLPVTSPTAFLPYVFDLMHEQLPPYFELLSEVAQKIGAIGEGRIVSPDGTELTEADLSPSQLELLHDYRLVQYDFSIGQRYAVRSMYYDFDNR